jgi:hypothetical protein
MKRSVIFLSAAGALLLTAAEPVILPEHSPEKDISGFVAVDPLQHCEVSCRTQGGLGKLRISIRQYDAAKRPIAATHVNASPETFTELAEPLARGGNSIVVKDASKWSFPAKGRIVVFGAKKDLSDLPNRKKAYYVAGVVQKGNLYVVTFDRSVNFDAPVGTGVRLHRDGGNVSFSCALPAEEAVSKIFKPAAPYGALQDSLWHGVAFIKIFAANASDEPVTVMNCRAALLSGEQMAQKERDAQAKAKREARKMAPYGFEKILMQKADEVVFLNHFFSYRKTRFYQSGVSSKAWEIPAREFGQFEIDIKSEISAYVMASFRLRKGEKTIRVATPYQ